MSIPSLRDALFIRLSELASALELFDFYYPGEEELDKAKQGWIEIKDQVAEQVAAIREES